jgi:hypothetical protein
MNPNQRLDLPRRGEEWRLTKIRLASKSYIMGIMHPPCGERRLRQEVMQTLSRRRTCQQSGLRRRLRANVRAMFFGQGVAFSAPDDFLRNALRRGYAHVCAPRAFVARPLEIST